MLCASTLYKRFDCMFVKMKEEGEEEESMEIDTLFSRIKPRRFGDRPKPPKQRLRDVDKINIKRPIISFQKRIAQLSFARIKKNGNTT